MYCNFQIFKYLHTSGVIMSASFTANEILYSTNSHLKSGHIDEGRGRIVWHLQDIEPGDWFIAIPSQSKDPHDQLGLAIERGARGLIVNRRAQYKSAPKDATIIAVPDTKAALLEMVRYWRHCVKPKVVGVTGSSGRRATMILLSQLLQENPRKTHCAFMHDLNWLGCAKDVLAMPRDTDVLIFEAGAVERGDIARIGGALDPDLAVLTEVQHPLPSPERDEFFAAMYCELLETLPEHRQDNLAAVVYDKNPAVQRKVQALCDVLVQRFSQSGLSLAHRVSEDALSALSKAMESSLGISVSRADLWCATEAAKALGLSQEALAQMVQLQAESESGNEVENSLKQFA